MMRVLVDTTYILPVVGVSVEGIERVLAKLKELRQGGAVEVYYSDFSVMEALAKAVKAWRAAACGREGLSVDSCGLAEGQGKR